MFSSNENSFHQSSIERCEGNNLIKIKDINRDIRRGIDGLRNKTLQFFNLVIKYYTEKEFPNLIN